MSQITHTQHIRIESTALIKSSNSETAKIEEK